MHDAHTFLTNLAMVLCVAAVTTVVCQKLRQPVVLGYLLAGALVSPHTPFPLFADAATIHTISELGVILLMFSLGIEFSFRKLLRIGAAAGFVAVVQCSLMIWLGYLTAQQLGWSEIESLYAGAIIAISSTTIIVKAFEEQRLRGGLTEIVFGILIFEDLIAIALLTVLTTISMGTHLSAGGILLMLGKLSVFLAAVVGGGLLLVPRLSRAIVRLKRPETTVVAHVGLCFAFALLAQSLGYSVALGAFLAGALVAESGEEKAVEQLVQPVRDIFGAVFFVAVGMLIDPQLVLEHWRATLIFSVVVVLGKLFSVTLGVFLTGQGVRTSVQAGMSLAQIGEFSFIIAGVGMATGATRNVLYVVAVAVSAITTLLTPWLIRASDPAAAFVDRHLPRRLQTLTALYGSWLEQLRSSGEPTVGAKSRRLLRLLLIDGAALALLVAATALWDDAIVDSLHAVVPLPPDLLWLILIAAAVVIALPFAVGLARCSSSLALLLATAAFPLRTGAPDTAAAPRRALIVLLQMIFLLLIGTPLVAITQPFLPGASGAAVLLLLMAIVAVALWRSAANLQEHARAGAMAIVEGLIRHVQSGNPEPTRDGLEMLNQILPGLGEPVAIQLDEASPAAGKTLADLNLRGATGAMVLAIVRRDGNVVTTPTGREILRANDTLAVAGTHDALAAARLLLLGGPPPAVGDALRESWD